MAKTITAIVDDGEHREMKRFNSLKELKWLDLIRRGYKEYKKDDE